jgi:prolyl-tRNA synthetase
MATEESPPIACKLLPLEIDVPLSILPLVSIIPSNLQAIGGDSSVAIDTIDKSSQDQLAMTSSTSTTVTDTGSHVIPDSPVLVDSSATNVPSKSIERIGTVATCDTTPTGSEVLPVTMDVSAMSTEFATFFVRSDELIDSSIAPATTSASEVLLTYCD